MAKQPSLLPAPRSYAGAALMIGAITALPFALIWSWLFSLMQQRPFSEILPFGLGAGLFFGIFFGLTMGFFVKGETISIKTPDQRQFVSRLKAAMAELGYNRGERNGDCWTFKPSVKAGLAAGRISIQFMEDKAVLVGPKMYLEKLRKRLSWR